MMKELLSRIYLTNFSLSWINKNSTFDDISNTLENVHENLKKYQVWKKFDIACVHDLLTFEYGADQDALEYDLLLASNYDDITYGYYLDLIEKTIGPYKSNITTQTALAKISSQDFNRFPRHYAYQYKEYIWPEIPDNLHTSDYIDTLYKNTDFIDKYHSDKEEFISFAVENFENLIFHPEITSTLDTIKDGTYLDYKKSILICLNSLNQSYNFISTDPTKNQDDLNNISNYTTILGKHFSCSRQGRNKPHFNFQENGHKTSINCEYHLKINWKDDNTRVNREDYVRIYFGLKFNETLGRKTINVAHIGSHYP